jgi:hypothetical protein
MDFDKALALLAAVIGWFTTIAIISVVVGPRSTAVPAIQATGNFVAGTVAAAVNPVHTAPTNGNPQLNAFTTPVNMTGPVPSWLSFGAAGASINNISNLVGGRT